MSFRSAARSVFSRSCRAGTSRSACADIASVSRRAAYRTPQARAGPARSEPTAMRQPPSVPAPTRCWSCRPARQMARARSPVSPSESTWPAAAATRTMGRGRRAGRARSSRKAPASSRTPAWIAPTRSSVAQSPSRALSHDGRHHAAGGREVAGPAPARLGSDRRAAPGPAPADSGPADSTRARRPTSRSTASGSPAVSSTAARAAGSAIGIGPRVPRSAGDLGAQPRAVFAEMSVRASTSQSTDRTRVTTLTTRTSRDSAWTTSSSTPTKPSASGTPAPSIMVCARSRSSAGSAW